MNIHPPILEGNSLSDEQKNLIAIFTEMKKNQLLFLDEAGKRIIELSTGLLGVLFAVTAFGNDFPPPYLKGNMLIQVLVPTTLVFFVIAVLTGVLTIQPRNYDFYERNLSFMRAELEKIVVYKSRWMKIATWSFYFGIVMLAILISILVATG